MPRTSKVSNNNTWAWWVKYDHRGKWTVSIITTLSNEFMHRTLQKQLKKP